MQYKIGKVSVINGSNVVTGTNTLFIANVSVGDGFKLSTDSVSYTVSAVVSDTSLELSAPYGGQTAGPSFYVISRDRTPNLGLGEITASDSDKEFWLTTEVIRKIDSTPLHRLGETEAGGMLWNGQPVEGGGGGSATLVSPITVIDTTLGTYSDGDVITAGTPLETVVRNMLSTVIPPTYAAPSLSISGGGSTSVEAGTSISPTITPTWTQRDAGAITGYTLNKGGSPIYTNPTAAARTDGAAVLGDTSVSYQATATYSQGPIKNDNQGNPYATGRIQAGSVTSGTITYTGRRNRFHSVNCATLPTTSADIRALTATLNSFGTFTLNIPAGSVRVVFAYPATYGAVSSVKYVELGNGEIKDTFALQTINVEGAAGFTAISYNVYTYTPAIPFGDNVTYTVTI